MSNAVASKTLRQGTAILLLTCSSVLAAGLVMEWGSVAEWRAATLGWTWLVTGLCFFSGLFLWQSSWQDQRSASLLRLDWFLPALRRIPPDESAGRSWLGRVWRRWIPAGQSNWHTKRRGTARRWLRRLGLSWVSSPLRRCCQAACWLLFGWLFFYVCWPYHAQPKSIQTLGSANFVAYDQASNQLLFSVRETRQLKSLPQIVFLSRSQTASAQTLGSETLGEFRVASVSATEPSMELQLEPLGEPNAALLDLITGLTPTGEVELLDGDPNAWPDHYALNLEGKEILPAESFLLIDPLVSLSTAIASRSWVWSLSCAAAILLVCVLIPRGFCGYLCPLGTTIDLFDWAIAGRTKRWRVPDEGWWVHLKYYLLSTVLLAACGGILLSGFVSAIPVLTRGCLFLLEPFQNGIARGWHLVPAWNLGHLVSVLLFLGVLGLGFLRPRFWCKYVCPSGAVFSIGNLLRVTERKVESSCIHCNKCVEICPFDAIKPDFTTRTTDCTLCQTCAGVCPTHAIKFVERTNLVQLKADNDPPTHETAIGRRGFLSLTAGLAASTAAATGLVVGAKTDVLASDVPGPIRPPGSVPESNFLDLCIRCGECFKVCPNNVLQAEGFQQGFEGLWAPLVEPDWAGCESSCHACGQVCPTGAIRSLPLEEKRHARMGLAAVNEKTCLPFAGTEACDLCVQECNAAGYEAIEFTQVEVELDSEGQPIDGTGFAAPVVLSERCVGCGLCQTRCHAINVKQRGLLEESAIVIETGPDKEDRILSGSYLELAESRRQQTLEDGANSATGSDNPGSPVDADQHQTGSDATATDESPF